MYDIDLDSEKIMHFFTSETLILDHVPNHPCRISVIVSVRM